MTNPETVFHFEHHASNPADLARRLAVHVADRLRVAIEARGQAVLAVSGGKSPIAMFEQLRIRPIEWSKVHVLLVDERCVPHDHADSNTALVRQHLLQEAAASAMLTPPFDALPDTLDEAALNALVQAADLRLAALPWPIDVAVLGMGEDGHTASLFPAAPGLETALRSNGPMAWVTPATAPHARLTLTLPALLASRELALAIAGENKTAVYRQALQKTDRSLPVSLILHQHQTPVSVWMA
jgi:6-phosphogluconolactonase